jgi:hypothetical protein
MKLCTRCLSSKDLSAFSPKQSHCKPCQAEKRAIWRKNNPDRVLAENAAYRAKNPSYFRQHYRKNLESESARKARYYLENKEIVRRRLDAYAEKNPHVRRAITAKRRAVLLKATPVWADFEKIKAFYETADALGMLTGEWHEVDHIIPLQGRTVCGLHCPANLQVVPRSVNRAKSNRVLDDMS